MKKYLCLLICIALLMAGSGHTSPASASCAAQTGLEQTRDFRPVADIIRPVSRTVLRIFADDLEEAALPVRICIPVVYSWSRCRTGQILPCSDAFPEIHSGRCPPLFSQL